MRFINLGRRNGRTTILVYTAHITNTPIIVFSERMKQHVIDIANRLSCDNIDVYTIEEYRNYMTKEDN